MSLTQSTAIACSNIALIKYWGNTNNQLRLAANPSLSMNLADLTIIATVEFNPILTQDTLLMNNVPAEQSAAQRVFAHLNLIRTRAGISAHAHVETRSNFPIGAGIASSAAAFAALSLAGSAAAGLSLTQAELSALARKSSGSASRSIPDGYCQWLAGGTDETSYATSIAPASHWNLRDLVAVVSTRHKQIGSTGGHALAGTSVLQPARVQSAFDRFEAARKALLNKNLAALGPIIEEDAVMMHSVMMTSRPPLYYWTPPTLAIIQAVQHWRADGVPVYFTIDAGPNVHLICEATHADSVETAVRAIPGVQTVLISKPGGPAILL